MRKHRLLSTKNPLVKLRTPEAIEIYFFRIFQLITSGSRRSQFHLAGLLSEHLDKCEGEANKGCPCLEIAGKLVGVGHLKKSLEEAKKGAPMAEVVTQEGS